MNKTQVITIRLTEREYEQLKAQAAASNQSISRYVAENATSANHMPPAKLRGIYQHLAIIKDCAVNDMANQRDIVKECDALWQLLN